MAKSDTKSVKIKTGKWATDSALPDSVKDAYQTEFPDWDWLYVSEGNEAWIIARLYEDGREFERVACKIHARRTV